MPSLTSRRRSWAMRSCGSITRACTPKAPSRSGNGDAGDELDRAAAVGRRRAPGEAGRIELAAVDGDAGAVDRPGAAAHLEGGRRADPVVSQVGRGGESTIAGPAGVEVDVDRGAALVAQAVGGLDR